MTASRSSHAAMTDRDVRVASPMSVDETRTKTNANKIMLLIKKKIRTNKRMT